MKAICINFQVHQPIRLKRYRFFQIGNDEYYFDDFQNKYLLNRIAERCYLPMNKLLLDLIGKFPDTFRVSFSISGTAIEQFAQYNPEVLRSFRQLAATGNVEFLAETYYHSLSALKSRDEFIHQVNEHISALKKHIGYSPITFRNTEMIYSDNIAEIVDEMGFDTILTEGAKHILGWKSPNFLYCNGANPRLSLLLRNFKLSDDIAFRFSNQSWSEWPLTAEKFVHWLNLLPPKEEIVNLFMDYETFGEHQLQETGIFDFFKALPESVFENSKYIFITPGEASEKFQPVSPVYVDFPISWADDERDLTAWLGNDLQKDAFEKIYALQDQVTSSGNAELIRVWRNLQTSDHFYYMSTKWFSDGDVHQYFNPYGSPYEAYINYMNVIADFTLRIHQNSYGTDNNEIQDKITETELIIQKSNEMKKNEGVKRGPGRPRKYPVKEQPASDAPKVRKPTRVKPKVNKFEEIMKIADNELKNFLRTLDTDIIFASLQGADEAVKDKVLSNITKRSLLKYEILMDTEPEKFDEKQVMKARRKMIKPFTNR
jgi:alpha-amylase